MNKRPNVILIVDDTPENLRVLGELLESDGHEVRVATNGAHGLEIATAQGVDLILLDIMMPEMDGYEVCQKLKRNKATRDLPVIFLTALDSPDDEAKGLKLGAVDYITKPFKLELVRTRVANQLALHNARQQLARHNEALEELVAERSQELSAAHKRLLTLDSAKYDFLQMIYQKLWAPGKGIIDLSRQALAKLDGGVAEYAALQRHYEESQAELFDTINNALLMAGNQSGGEVTKRHPVRLEVVVADAQAKWQSLANGRRLNLTGDLGQPPLAAGDLDLVYQVVATAIHVGILIAREGTALTFAMSSQGEVAVEISVTVGPQASADLKTLFDEATRFHASDVGRALGLAVPLAAKIARTQGGSISIADRGQDRWTLRVALPRFVKEQGVRITL